jgi:chromosome segregation ATPase
MAATEHAIIPSTYTMFDSSIVKLILTMATQQQQIVVQQQENNSTEELINKLEQEKNELKIQLEPHKKYQTLFDDTIIELKLQIQNIRNIQCKPWEEEIKTTGINQLKAKILECQLHFNKTGIVAHIKEQEKKLAQLDEQISELKQNLNEGKVKLSALQDFLTKMEQELERKKPQLQKPQPGLVFLGVQKIKAMFAALNEQPVVPRPR